MRIIARRGSQAVDLAVDGWLDLAVPLGRDGGGGTSGSQIGEDEVGIVSLVGEQDARRGPKLVRDGAKAFHIGDLTAAQRDRDRESNSVAAEMDLGR